MCVCHLQPCQTGTQTGTEYLEKRYWDERLGEKTNKNLHGRKVEPEHSLGWLGTCLIANQSRDQ